MSAAAQNTWVITSSLPFQEIPEYVLILCPQLAKKGERRTNRYQHPSCDLAHKEIKKVNPIHNLYNLTLGRKQHLGSTPSGTVLLDVSVLPALSDNPVTREHSRSSPVQQRQCIFLARGNLLQKRGEWREGNIYSLPVECLAKAPLTLQREGKVEPLPKGGSWTNYCLASQNPEWKLM